MIFLFKGERITNTQFQYFENDKFSSKDLSLIEIFEIENTEIGIVPPGVETSILDRKKRTH